MQMHKTSTTIGRKLKVPYHNIIDTRMAMVVPLCYCEQTILRQHAFHRQIYSSQRQRHQGVNHKKGNRGYFDIWVHLRRGISVAAISGRSICVSPISGRSISVFDMSAILTRHATFLRTRCKIPHVHSHFTSTWEANTGVAQVHRYKLYLINQGIVFTSPDKTS